MPLPELLEIIPPAPVAPVAGAARVTVPGSKSITNRALILAALGRGTTTLRGALWSEDTQVMCDCLARLGFAVRIDPDPAEPGNRVIQVTGAGGVIPAGGTAAQPLDLHVGNAGTAARFLAAFVALGSGVYRLSGVPRMHERPQAALFSALRDLGVRIETPNDRLPAVIVGGTARRGGSCSVSVAESSQFASALLLVARPADWTVTITGANEDELPYVDMTRELAAVFPTDGGTFQIEPDASSGSYFWGAGAILGGDPDDWTPATSPVQVCHWPDSGWQIDARFPACVPLSGEISRARDLGDSIMTAIVLAALRRPEDGPVRFTDLGRLRLQECERVVALRTELTRCGGRVEEAGDTLTVAPGRLHGATIETYHDHRMAMCFAMLGLRVPGIILRNPACVKKTFPNFFQKLAAPLPGGLGVVLREPGTGRVLAPDELYAD